MVTLDYMHPFWVSADYAAKHIQSSWIGQYTSESLIGKAIRFVTQGAHSHSAMFRRDGDDGDIDVLELREFKNGRALPIELHIKTPGYRLDVFSSNAGGRWPEFDPVGAVEVMRDLTAYKYGWAGIWQMFLRRVPLSWRFVQPETRDFVVSEDTPVKPFCSHAVSLATDVGGGVDPVPRLPHYLVSPGQLTNSLFYEYEFSIVTDYTAYVCGEEIRERASTNEIARDRMRAKERKDA